MIGIALVAVAVAAIAYMAGSSKSDVDVERQKAAATVVVKRVADLVTEHQTQVATGDVSLGAGFASSLSTDVAKWPKEAFVDGVRGTAVNEGSVTYITGISEEFCKTLNAVVQVNGIPNPEDGPNDRISCVLAPAV